RLASPRRLACRALRGILRATPDLVRARIAVAATIDLAAARFPVTLAHVDLHDLRMSGKRESRPSILRRAGSDHKPPHGRSRCAWSGQAPGSICTVAWPMA